MAKKGYSLIEVMAALALVGLLVLMLYGAFGGSFHQYSLQKNRESKIIRGQNAMESAMAYGDAAGDGTYIVFSDYGRDLEKIEVFDEESGEKLFVSLRPKKSIYAH